MERGQEAEEPVEGVKAERAQERWELGWEREAKLVRGEIWTEFLHLSELARPLTPFSHMVVKPFSLPPPTPHSPLLNREGLLGTLMNSLGLMDSRAGRVVARLLP